ncbi:hypothetical protein YC2023_056996 [Brassica napus]
MKGHVNVYRSIIFDLSESKAISHESLQESHFSTETTFWLFVFLVLFLLLDEEWSLIKVL